MPTISLFFGIIIRIYWGAIFDLEGNALEGQLPKRKERNVAAWAGIHHDELLANWELASNNKDVFKVDQLR